MGEGWTHGALEDVADAVRPVDGRVPRVLRDGPFLMSEVPL